MNRREFGLALSAAPLAGASGAGARTGRDMIELSACDAVAAMRAGDVWAGFRAPLLEGANNWPGIMKALDEVGFRDYLITEQGGGDTPEGLRDLCQRLEKIIAG